MKIAIITLITLLSSGCSTHSEPNKKNLCATAMMKPALYEVGIVSDKPKMNIKPDSFVVFVDTSIRSQNFVSMSEFFWRKQSIKPDTFGISSEFDTLSPKQRRLRIKEIKQDNLNMALKIHQENNKGQLLVYLVNNSKGTIDLQIHLGELLCILEAKDSIGNWKPIEFMREYFCGNAFGIQRIPPNKSSSFISNYKSQGNYSTCLHFKILGLNKFYYSNEFKGSINYCEFVDDTTHFKRKYKFEQHIRVGLNKIEK